MQDLRDNFGRSFKTLRVSLLSACNLGCVYCSLGEGTARIRKEQTAATEFLRYIHALHEQLELTSLRLTGGEPLLYQELPKLIEGVVKLGIPNIKLTTNGFLLERQVLDLKLAGLKAVNVSLDAVEETTFYRMSKRRGVQQVLAGIDAALQAGLEVKINSVIMRDLNDDQILPLARWAFSRNIQIRFLEIMAMGHLHKKAGQYLYSQEEILTVLASEWAFEKVGRMPSATATYWNTTSGHSFGLVANESEPFCSDCNRLRLDAQGNIFGCLSSNNPISIRNIRGKEELSHRLQQALAQKQELRFVGSELSMLDIGG